jgi:hypothetical protein
MKLHSRGERPLFAIAGAVLGLCMLVVQARSAPLLPREPDSLEVLVFATRVNAAQTSVPGEALTLRFNITHGLSLPPQLTLYELEGPVATATDGLIGAVPDGAVVAVYSKLGLRVSARDVAGSSAAPAVAGQLPIRYRLIVLSNPSAGNEQEYNDWYDHQHVPDVLRVPGFSAAQRLRLATVSPATTVLPRYAVNFEFESADLQATIADVRHRLATGVTRSSSAFDITSSLSRYYEIAAP